MSYVQVETPIISRLKSIVYDQVCMVTANLSCVSDVAHLYLNSMSTLTSDLPWYCLIISLTLFAVIIRALHQAYGTSLRDIPGPWQAKFTRLWLLRAISSRSFQKTNLDLHRKHGPSVKSLPLPLIV